MRDVIRALATARAGKPIDQKPELPQVAEFRRALQAQAAARPR